METGHIHVERIHDGSYSSLFAHYNNNSNMSTDVAALQDETTSELMDLPLIRNLLPHVLEDPSHEGLAALLEEIPQLLSCLLREKHTEEHQEATMIWIFCKVMQEFGKLPQVLSAESLFLDLCVAPETAQRLQQNKAEDIAHFYSLFKRETSRRRFKRSKRATTDDTTQMQSAVVVKFVALVTRMACAVSSSGTSVDWTTVEKQVRLWLVGSSFLRADVTAGLALAALDIVDSCQGEPTVNDVTITGLTPRRIYNMLQIPSVVDWSLVNACRPLPRLHLVTCIAQVLLRYAQSHPLVDLDDAARVCRFLVKSAFAHTVAFLLDQLANTEQHQQEQSGNARTTTNNNSKKRKRAEKSSSDEPDSSSSRMIQVRNPAFPFLVQIQVHLANDGVRAAINVASLLERCPCISSQDKHQAWWFILDYLRHTGDLFLDGNDVHSSRYQEKRNGLLELRRFTGNLGFTSMIDFYVNFMDQVSEEDVLVTSEERHYLVLGCQQTCLKLILDKAHGNVNKAMERFRVEFPQVYLPAGGKNAREQAIEFGMRRNPIPTSLLMDNGVDLDLNSFWNRAPPTSRVELPAAPAAASVAEQEDSGVDVAEEQVVVDKAVEEAHVEEPVVQPHVEELLDSEEEEEEEQPVEPEEPHVQKLLDLDEEEEEERSVEEILSSDEEERSVDEIFDSSDDGMMAIGSQEAAGDEPVVDLLGSTSEEEEEADDGEQESVSSEGTEEYERPAARAAREDQETADEDDVADTFGFVQRQVEAETSLPVFREAIDNYDEETAGQAMEEGAYDSQEEIQSDDGRALNASNEEEGEQQDAEALAAQEASQGDGDGVSQAGRDEASDVEESATAASEQQAHHIDKGYEPDTTAQTEEEEEDEKKIAAANKKTPPPARGFIASRTTLSDMDAADERTEPSDAEDQRPTSSTSRMMESEASSTLVSAVVHQQDSPAKEAQVADESNSPFHPPAARPPVQVDGGLQEDSAALQQIVNQVPQIDDVHPGKEGTNDTVEGRSEALSEARTEEMAPAEQLEEENAHGVDHVPVVEDARAGDDTSAAFAASETGQYLSEAGTEDFRQPQESTETTALETTVGVSKDVKKSGNESDVGYMGDIEEKPSSTAAAPATAAAFSMQAPGYEADVEERTLPRNDESHDESHPTKSSPTARAMPTGLNMKVSAAEDDSIVVHPNTDDGSVSGYSAAGSTNRRSNSLDASENAVAPDYEAKTTGVETAEELASAAGTELAEEAKAANVETTEKDNAAKVETTTEGNAAEVETTEEAKAAKVETTEEAKAAGVAPTEEAKAAKVETTEEAKAAEVDTTEEAKAADVETTEEAKSAEVKTTQEVEAVDVETTEENNAAEVETTEEAKAAGVESAEEANATGDAEPIEEAEATNFETTEEVKAAYVETAEEAAPAEADQRSKTLDGQGTEDSISAIEDKDASPLNAPETAQPDDEKTGIEEEATSASPTQVAASLAQDIQSNDVEAESESPRNTTPPKPSPTHDEEILTEEPSSPPRPDRRASNVFGSPASHTRSHDIESPSAARARSEESGVSDGEVPLSTPSRPSRRSSRVIGSPASHTRSHDLGSPASHTRSHDLGSPGVKAESSSQKRGRPGKKRGPGRPRKNPEADVAPVKKRGRGRGRPRKSQETAGDDEEDVASVSSKATRSTRSRELGSPGAHTRSHDSRTALESSPPRKRRGRPPKRQKTEVDEEKEREMGSLEAHTRSHDSHTEASPPRKRRGSPKRQKTEADEEEKEQELGSPVAHTRSHDSHAAKEYSPPRKPRGRPPKRQKTEADEEEKEREVGSPEAHTRSHDSHATTESSPLRTRRGRPPKKPKTKADDEEDTSSVASRATRSSARLRAKPAPVASSSSTSRKSARTRRSTREESDDSDDEVDSQASTKKSRPSSRKGKRKSQDELRDRDSLGSVPEGLSIPDGDGGSVSSMESSTASRRPRRRTTRAAAGRDSLSTIPESPGVESSTPSSRTARSKASPKKRKTRSTTGSVSSASTTTSRYNLRSRK